MLILIYTNAFDDETALIDLDKSNKSSKLLKKDCCIRKGAIKKRLKPVKLDVDTTVVLFTFHFCLEYILSVVYHISSVAGVFV